jgi:probable rRNA maturation factor
MIINRQRAIRVPTPALERFLARAMKALRLPADAATVCLVTNAQIAKWNASYRGKNKPTDVLSFSADSISSSKGVSSPKGRAGPKSRRGRSLSAFFAASTSYLGDIAIAPAIARRNALLYGRSLDDEMRILILHGLLHLMGYDHETDTGQMDRREKRLRRALGIS